MKEFRQSKRFLALLLSALMVIALVACGGGAGSSDAPAQEPAGEESTEGDGTAAEAPAADTGDKIVVTFWNGWSGPDGELLTQLVDQYNEKNTKNVYVDMDIMEFASLTEKLATSLASNTNPNLHLGFAKGPYSVEGQYIPIDDIFDKTDLDRSDFDEGILEQCTYNGQLYGLPFQISSHYLFWNKDLFEQAGLDPDVPPATWDELLEYSAKIDELGGNIQGGGFAYNYAALLPAIMASYGGQLVVDDGDGARAVLTDPEYIDANRAALQMISDYATQSTNNTTNDNYEATYQAGTCAMISTGAWQLAGAKDYGINYGVSLLPQGDAGHAQPGSPVAMCVMKNTEGEVLDAVYDFLAYWNNNINNPLVDECPAYTWSEKQGYQPYLLSIASDERLLNDPDSQVTNSYIDYICTPWGNNFYDTYAGGETIVKPMAENVALGLMSIDEALELAQEELEAMIATMKFG